MPNPIPEIRSCTSLNDITASDWDALNTTRYPFLRHAFLAGLESSHSVCAETGWEPNHLLAYHGDTLVGALPRYRKHHSWGEFVFDHAWANASHQAGVPYYPKGVTSIPFTPHPGPRVLTSCDETLSALIKADNNDSTVSSNHWLFIEDTLKQPLETEGWLLRRGCQYHWKNHGYNDFDGFLGSLTSVKRKKLKRERRRVAESGIRIERLLGHEIPADLWDDIYLLYSNSFLIRGNEPYYKPGFLQQIAKEMGQQMMLPLCYAGDELVACAITFFDDECLYGRHWGAKADFHSLHFETCFYQGIEFCIERGLQTFQPGAQGEHKITRGFEPVPTWSAHRLGHEGLHRAVADYLRREEPAVAEMQEDLSSHLPFKSHTANNSN